MYVVRCIPAKPVFPMTVYSDPDRASNYSEAADTAKVIYAAATDGINHRLWL